VQLVKSFFCVQGRDNRQRFLSIAVACHVAILLFKALFFGLPTLSIILLLLAAVPFSLSALRRMRDAAKPVGFTALASTIFLLVGFGLAFIDHGASYLLLLLSLATVLGLTSFAGQSGQADYIKGYAGPVDLSGYKNVRSYSSFHASRIEPTMAGGHSEMVSEQPMSASAEQPDEEQAPSVHTDQDWSKIALEWVQDNRQKTLLLGASLLLVSMIGIVVAFWPASIPADVINETIEPQRNIAASSHRLDMPDDFALLLDANQALIINWQADETISTQLWSVISAKGDKTCSNITFNNNDQVRSTQVLVENASDYFAYFSPLDTQRLIKSVANRVRATDNLHHDR